jgi:hypothetical protein
LSEQLHAHEGERAHAISAALARAGAEHALALADQAAASARREQELAATVEALRHEVRLREADLLELRVFRDERERFTAQMDDLRARLETDRAAHAADVERRERSRMIETDSLKREMLRRVQAAKASFGAIASGMLERTLQTTVLEHHMMGRELIEQAQSTDATLAENTKLRTRNAELRRSVELLEEQVTEHARRTRLAQRALERRDAQPPQSADTERTLWARPDGASHGGDGARGAPGALALMSGGASSSLSQQQPYRQLQPQSAPTRPWSARGPARSSFYAGGANGHATPALAGSVAPSVHSTGNSAEQSRVATAVRPLIFDQLLMPRPPPVGQHYTAPKPPPEAPFNVVTRLSRPGSSGGRRRPLSAR